MFDVNLFLGVENTRELETLINKANPHAVSIFINNDSEYLQKCIYQNKLYIGKIMSVPTELSNIDLLEANIESLFRKFIPEFSLSTFPLKVLATTQQTAKSHG